jgi:hypothetical protein
MEMMPSRKTKDVLEALFRTATLRGFPEWILSDNAGEFVSSKTALETVRYESDEFNYMHGFNKVSWQTYPARAPQWGGAVESCVKLARHALVKIAPGKEFTDLELVHTLRIVQEMINRRPLGLVDAATDPTTTLTPAHFMIGKDPYRLDKFFDLGRAGHTEHWQEMQKQLQIVWKMLLEEVIPHISKRQNTKMPRKNMREGDVVAVSELEPGPRGYWPIGLITKAYKGKDGLVRAVEVRVRGRLHQRTVTSLVPIC